MSDDSTLAFIPLSEAAALVCRETSGGTGAEKAVLEQFAALIAQHAGLYGREGWGNEIKLIPATVLQRGVFQYGGELMRSRNITYSDLRVRRSDLPHVIHKLSGSDVPNDQA